MHNKLKMLNKHNKLEKEYQNKVYVFKAIINDAKQLKKNKDLSRTFRVNAFKTLMKRAEVLKKQILNIYTQQIAIWERTVA
tara:strand:- start:5 stop:247 length:243 start_codon:yes stop_codon:yes gene_type:complete